MECDPFDFVCKMQISLMNSVGDFIGRILLTLATVWVQFPTEPVSGSELDSLSPPEPVTNEWASWLTWGGMGIAIGALIVVAVMWAWKGRSDFADEIGSRFMWIIIGCILLGTSGTLVGNIIQTGSSTGMSTTVESLREYTSPWTLGLALCATIIGVCKIIVDGRGTAMKDVLRGLVTLLAVTSFSVFVVQQIITATDKWSLDIVYQAFGATNEAELQLKFVGVFGMTMGVPNMFLLVLLLGVVMALCSAIQVVLLIGRSAILTLLVGILPLAASMAGTPTGQKWFQKVLGWLIGFALYKPVAALIYVAAFTLQSSAALDDVGQFLTGLALMILGLVAMPAIMRLVAPAVGAITAGAGFGGAVGATAGTVAQGAMMMRMYGGSSGGGGSGGNTPTGSPPAGSPPAGSPPAGSSPAGSSPAGNLPAAGNSTMTVSSSGGAAASVAGPVAVGLAAGAQVLSSTQMIVKSGAEGSMNVGSGSDTTTLGW